MKSKNLKTEERHKEKILKHYIVGKLGLRENWRDKICPSRNFNARPPQLTACQRVVIDKV